MSVSIERWPDPSIWNQFVASLPMAHFQQSWEWGELAPILGGEPLRLAALESGKLVGAMQLFVNPIGRTSWTYLSVPRGPALAAPRLPVLGALLDRARMIGLERRALGIRIDPNASQGDITWQDTLATLSLRPTFPPSQPRSSWLLDLTPEPDVLLAQMKQKTRYNIRLAARKGIDVAEGRDADLDEFYCLYEETARRDDFFIHSKSVYQRMFELFRQGDMFCMLLARHQGKLIAATTLVRFGRTCWYLHGASSSRHRNLMAPYLLQWEGIQRARRWGCTLYDFRAIPDILREDQDMFGVFRFKEGFGGFPTTTLHTYTQPYKTGLFGLWQLYFSGRFAVDAWRRRRAGLPARQFA